MNRDEIIRMAREAGSIDSEDVIETVYAAFSAAEREACVQEIRGVRECIGDGLDGVIKETARNVCDNMIIRVQARGKQ
jgi:hypothetical protein